MIKRFLAPFLLVLCTLSIVVAQNVPQPMRPARLVNDFAGLFTPAQRQTLEDSLVAFDRSTSSQIAVVTVNDLDDYAVGDYALAILRQWGVGKKDKNNGVVLLIKPRNEYGAGQVYIATGFGVEGVLPDSKTGRIIDIEMIPALKQGDYYTAAVYGTTAIRAALRGEYTADAEKDVRGWTVMIPFGIFILVIIIISIFGKKGKYDNDDDQNGGSGGRRNVWIPPFIIGSILGGSGRGGGGSAGGGGFGGFGGGFGGGGGAGRSF